MGLSYIKVHDHSGTMMTTPLPTTKTTTWPTNTNLNICSTLNNSSQNVHPSPKFKILLDDSALACWSVEFGFNFHRTYSHSRLSKAVSLQPLQIPMYARSSQWLIYPTVQPEPSQRPEIHSYNLLSRAESSFYASSSTSNFS